MAQKSRRNEGERTFISPNTGEKLTTKDLADMRNRANATTSNYFDRGRVGGDHQSNGDLSSSGSSEFIDLRRYAFDRTDARYRSVPRPRANSASASARNTDSLRRQEENQAPPAIYSTGDTDLSPYRERPLKRSGSFRKITQLLRKSLRKLGTSSNNLANSGRRAYPQQLPPRPTSAFYEAGYETDAAVPDSDPAPFDDNYSHISAPPLLTSAASTAFVDRTPATSGIVNHGNTCYINAIIQCLSNTDAFAEYLVTQRYLDDLYATSTTVTSKRYRKAPRSYAIPYGGLNGGERGDVTNAVAGFLRAIWFNDYSRRMSEGFKRVVERNSEQYCGNQQQDSQEFLCWLLDKIHEDLNTATKKKYKPIRHSSTRDEVELAQATLESHLLRDQSFVTDLFRAQFRSCVKCRMCGYSSRTFDPYSVVSVPMPPQRSMKPLFVVLVFQNRYPRLLCLGLNAEMSSTFGEVADCLCKEAHIAQNQLVVCELKSNGFHRTFRRAQTISTLGRQTDTVYAFETPPIASRSTIAIDDTRPEMTDGAGAVEELVVLATNRLRSSTSDDECLRFGGPIAIRVTRDISYAELCRRLLAAMRPQLRSTVSLPDVALTAFKLRLADTFVSEPYLPAVVEMPLYVEQVESVLAVFSSPTSRAGDYGPVHLKLLVEWDPMMKDRYFDNDEVLVDHVSAVDLRDEVVKVEGEVPTLSDCLKMYTQPEQLDEWMCSACRRDRPAEKTITFWSLPDVLVLHLKRFKMNPRTGEQIKLDQLVTFPVEKLDMAPFVYEDMSASQSQLANGYPPQRNRARSPQPQRRCAVDSVEDTLYDLYAVCNHHGESMNSGHYTAFCRNPVDAGWYAFDDEKVAPIAPKDLVTNGAYLLFYERRVRSKPTVNGAATFPLASSVESGFCEHWVYRLAAAESCASQRSSLALSSQNGAYSVSTTNGTYAPNDSAATNDDVRSASRRPEQNGTVNSRHPAAAPAASSKPAMPTPVAPRVRSTSGTQTQSGPPEPPPKPAKQNGERASNGTRREKKSEAASKPLIDFDSPVLAPLERTVLPPIDKRGGRVSNPAADKRAQRQTAERDAQLVSPSSSGEMVSAMLANWKPPREETKTRRFEGEAKAATLPTQATAASSRVAKAVPPMRRTSTVDEANGQRIKTFSRIETEL